MTAVVKMIYLKRNVLSIYMVNLSKSFCLNTVFSFSSPNLISFCKYTSILSMLNVVSSFGKELIKKAF